MAVVFGLCGDAGPAFAADLGPLTNIAGDPARGEALLRDMTRVSCLICHRIAGLDEKDQGEIGPSLEEVALRLSEAGLRQRIVDPRKINPDTIMPPYFSLDGLFEVGADFQDNTIYSAQEVEDVVSYLLTLTGGFQK